MQHVQLHATFFSCIRQVAKDKISNIVIQNIDNMNTILNQYNNRVCNHIITTLYHLQLKVHI
jgi:hypothetical protein